MSTTFETCANCGRSIGRLETPAAYGESVVCAACKRLLDAEASTPPSAAAIAPAAVSGPQAIDYATGERRGGGRALRIVGVALLAISIACVAWAACWSLYSPGHAYLVDADTGARVKDLGPQYPKAHRAWIPFSLAAAAAAGAASTVAARRYAGTRAP